MILRFACEGNLTGKYFNVLFFSQSKCAHMRARTVQILLIQVTRSRSQRSSQRSTSQRSAASLWQGGSVSKVDQVPDSDRV